MMLRDILQVKGSQVYSVRPDQTVQEAVGILMQHRVGALLVVDAQGRGVGIISERDILRECLHRGDQLGRIPVHEAMTRDVIIGLPDDDIGHAMSLMTNNRVRHLPVMDGSAVAGLVSIGDVVKALLDETAYENRYLKEYMFGRWPSCRLTPLLAFVRGPASPARASFCATLEGELFDRCDIGSWSGPRRVWEMMSRGWRPRGGQSLLEGGNAGYCLSG